MRILSQFNEAPLTAPSYFEKTRDNKILAHFEPRIVVEWRSEIRRTCNGRSSTIADIGNIRDFSDGNGIVKGSSVRASQSLPWQ
jgi:hypothetical protein